jgi:hypothetical protein
MKLVIQVRKILIAVSNFFPSIIVQDFQSFLFERRHPDRAHTRSQTFEFSQCLKHVVELLDINSCNCDALSWRHLDEPGAAQSSQRLANWRPGNAEFSADAWFVKSSPGRDRPGQNVLHQRFKYLVGECHGQRCPDSTIARHIQAAPMKG